MDGGVGVLEFPPERGFTMRRNRVLTLLGAVLLCSNGIALQAQAPASRPSPAVVSLGGAVTEAVYALGMEEFLVAVDQSSLYPVEATRLPDVGYFRALATEGVLSLEPDLVLASVGSGPPVVLDQIRQAGIEIIMIPSDDSPEGAQQLVTEVANAFGIPDRGADLVRGMQAKFDKASELRSGVESRPKVLFVWGRGGRSLVVGGEDTGANTMIDLIGAQNAVTGFSGYEPLTPEAAIAAEPEVIIIDDDTLELIGGIDGLLATPGLAATPAGRERRVVGVDLLEFLAFGPRTGDAVLRLLLELHPDLAGR